MREKVGDRSIVRREPDREVVLGTGLIVDFYYGHHAQKEHKQSISDSSSFQRGGEAVTVSIQTRNKIERIAKNNTHFRG